MVVLVLIGAVEYFNECYTEYGVLGPLRKSLVMHTYLKQQLAGNM
jgi:hypothetical protein